MPDQITTPDYVARIKALFQEATDAIDRVCGVVGPIASLDRGTQNGEIESDDRRKKKGPVRVKICEPPMGQCQDCRFWNFMLGVVKVAGVDGGSCENRGPEVQFDFDQGDGYIGSLYTAPTFGCVEYQAKKETEG